MTDFHYLYHLRFDKAYKMQAQFCLLKLIQRDEA